MILVIWFLCVLERELSGKIVIAKEEIYSKGVQESDVEEQTIVENDEEESDGSLEFNEDEIYKKKKKDKKKKR